MSSKQSHTTRATSNASFLLVICSRGLLLFVVRIWQSRSLSLPLLGYLWVLLLTCRRRVQQTKVEKGGSAGISRAEKFDSRHVYPARNGTSDSLVVEHIVSKTLRNVGRIESVGQLYTPKLNKGVSLPTPLPSRALVACLRKLNEVSRADGGCRKLF